METQDVAVPFGYCHCGCGEMAPVAPRTYAKRGIFKGQPFRFIKGHQRRGTGLPAIERFMAMTRADDATGCVVWTGALYGNNNYGAFSIGRVDGKPTVEAAHRWSYEHHVGPIPEGLKVLHSCDNPPCVNPAHLFIGTQADNIADMWAKGRSRFQREGRWPVSSSTAGRRTPKRT